MTPYYVNPSTKQPAAFRAVKVTGGRKYHGTGFIVSITTSSGACGWKHTGYGWSPNCYETETAKIWVPSLKKFQYANMKYVEDDASVSKEECSLKFKEYADSIIQSTIDWCHSQKPDGEEREVARFARNVLLKHHPEIRAEIDAMLPDSRDLKSEIDSTIAWSKTLTDRRGQPLENGARMDVCRKALAKRGLTSFAGFEEAFIAECTAASLC